MKRKVVWRKQDERGGASRDVLREERMRKPAERPDAVRIKFQEGQGSAVDLNAPQRVQE